jgi:hypothetical protein
MTLFSRTSLKMKVLMVIAVVAVLSAVPAFAFKVHVGPVHVDTSKPLNPVQVDPTKVGPVTVHPGAPGVTPQTPSARFDKSVPGSKALNEMDKLLHKPEQMARAGLDATTDGLKHLGNEIGMAWAKTKEKAEQYIQKWADWLIEQIKAYAPLALAALFGLMVLAFFVAMLLLRLLGAAARAVMPRRRRSSRAVYAR